MTDEGSGAQRIDQADWHKHMDYVQAVIARLANNSFVLKGWALTLTSALIGFAVTRGNVALAVLAVFVVLAFWFLDAYFLRHERAFRLMFAAVASKELGGFDLNPAPYAADVGWWRTIRSLSLSIFYGALLAVSLALAVIVVSAPGTLARDSPAPSPSVTATT